MSARVVVLVLTLTGLAIPLRSLAAGRPVSASPGGSRQFAVVDGACPTFSWSAVAGARGYDLEVYRVPEPANEIGGAPMLTHRVKGQATSWTPDRVDCFGYGGRYGWIVRGVLPDAVTQWSEPLLFQLEAAPSEAEVRRALDTLERHLAAPAAEADDLAGPRRDIAAPAPVGVASSPRSTEAETRPRKAALPAPGSPAERMGIHIEFSYPFDDQVTTGIYASVESDNGGAAIVGSGRVYTSATTPGPVDGVRGFSQEDTGVYGEGSIGVEGMGNTGQSIGGAFQGLRGIVATGTSCCNGTELDNYAGQIANDSTLNDPDALALYINKPSVTSQMNYIGFFDASGSDPFPATLIGEIEGDGQGGVRYRGRSVQLQPTDSPGACDSSSHGSLYFDKTLQELCYCPGSGGWQPVDGTGVC